MDNHHPNETDWNFERSSLKKLYSSGSSGEINPERWDRVRNEIRFEDVVSELTGHGGSSSMRCPFHGRDSTPSFFLYKGTNDGWCFGCETGSQYYDHVRFVSKYREISRTAALRWIEKKWDLPPLANIPLEEDQDEDTYITTYLTWEDIQEPFILKAIKQVSAFRDVELAEDYISYYFKSLEQLKLAEALRKEGEHEDALAAEAQAVKILARAYGKEDTAKIWTRKKMKNQ